MSINLGIYDFFAYLVPGFLYLFLINDFFARMGWASYDLAQANQQIGIGTIGAVVLAAYIVGHLFDFFAHWFCYSLLTRKSMAETALEQIKRQYPALKIAFEPKDYHLLFVLLRQRNPQYTQTLDRFEANSILLKNVSFAAVLFVLGRAILLFTGFSLPDLLLLLAGLLASWLAFRGSKMYHGWFFLDVFEATLDYGTSIRDVLDNKKPNKPAS